ETVAHARAYAAAAEATGDAADLVAARFVLAAVLLWHDALDEAEPLMRQTLHEAQRIGDVTLQSRCFTYLAILHRRRGRGGETLRAASQGLAVATEGALRDYAAAATANLGWAALREGYAGEAERQTEAALAAWGALEYAYPFQWLALLPLCALRLD